MNKTNLLLSAALTGIFAAGVVAATQAEDKAMGAAMASKEKCYGIAKAGKNDCASASGSHACAGKATMDNSGDDFVLAGKEDCAKMGGSTTPKK